MRKDGTVDTMAGLWVNCPKCGNRVLKAKFGDIQYHCRCGVDFNACVTNGMVTTVVCEGNEEVSITERLDKYRKQMECFTT